ncbi:18S rRNA maturation protein [Xylographa trunciseda]|nr:18S rRNA maturation protein [Xylographa trunciseda]
MGTKRPSSDSVHPSRKPNISGNPDKRHRSNHYATRARPSSHSANALKSKIRDLTRLLDHSKDMPADVRMEKDRALAGYRADLESALDEKRKADMIKRYHMVRFFGSERQKATRALKKLQKALDAATSETIEQTKLRSTVHEAEVDLNYTLYYPLAEKYQSLYPRKETQEFQDDEERNEVSERKQPRQQGEKPPLWFLIERAMAEGTLEALRDGKRDMVVSINPKPQASIRSKTAKGTETRKTIDINRGGGVTLEGETVSDNKDDMSDGGFFDE